MLCTVLARPSVLCPSTRVYQKPLHGTRPTFTGSYLSGIISRPFFFFFKLSILPLTWDPVGAKLSKRRYFFHSFCPIPKIYDEYVNHGESRIFLADLPKTKNFCGTLKFLLTQDHRGLEISKRFSYSFHPISTKLYEGFGDHGGIQAITNLSAQVLKMLCTSSQWENPKMCNILKTADSRAKQMKIWDSQYYKLHVENFSWQPGFWV